MSKSIPHSMRTVPEYVEGELGGFFVLLLQHTSESAHHSSVLYQLGEGNGVEKKARGEYTICMSGRRGEGRGG